MLRGLSKFQILKSFGGLVSLQQLCMPESHELATRHLQTFVEQPAGAASGQTHAQVQESDALAAGYWPLKPSADA